MAVLGTLGKGSISSGFTNHASGVKNINAPQPTLKNENKDNKTLGGNNMNTQINGWGTVNNTNTGVNTNGGFNNNQSGSSTPSGWASINGNNQNVGGVAGVSSNNGATSSGANWGTSGNVNIASSGGQFDKSAPAKEAIKKLAGRLLEIVPKLSNEEFNELAKIYDFADIKDEFIQRSGRQDTYLDNNTAVQAVNELNAVFLEHNQKSADLSNTLGNIANNLNQGQCDPTAIYNFILNAINSGAIPANIQNDNSKQHITKVVKMALAFKNGGTQYGMSGANWGGNSNQSVGSGWGSFTSSGFGTFNNNNNNNGFSSWGTSNLTSNSGGGWLTTSSNSNGAWGSMSSGFNNNNNNNSGGFSWPSNNNNSGSWANNTGSSNSSWLNNSSWNNNGGNNNWMSSGSNNNGSSAPWMQNNNNNNNGGFTAPWMNNGYQNGNNNNTVMFMN